MTSTPSAPRLDTPTHWGVNKVLLSSNLRLIKRKKLKEAADREKCHSITSNNKTIITTITTTATTTVAIRLMKIAS